jgi:hypothetical protein
MITVKPAQGKMIRDPVTQQFVDPDKGMRVDPNDLYWRRRLRDGDVVTADDAADTAPAATKATAKTAAKGAPATGASATQDSGEKQ